jgi:hydroxyacylglutathione hydrolase
MDDLYFKRLLIGPMQNFVYLIGSTVTRECLIVDPAWDTDALLEVASADDMQVVGALVTHYHPDHVGGAAGTFRVPGGVAELLGKVPARVHVNKHEAAGLKFVTGLSDNDLVQHEGGDLVSVGDVSVTLIHTPGHTPGSQCFLVRDRLVAGDTLFIDGCGRVDLPGGDAAQMSESLRTLAKLPDDVVLHPGHHYADRPSQALGPQKRSNPALVRAQAERPCS